MKKGGGDAGTAKYSSNNIMSLSYAAHINGDKVYDIATGYWIEAKQEATASTGRMQWAVYLYDDTGTFVEKYVGGNFPEADKDKWLFVGFDMNINTTNASWRIFTQYLPSYSVSQNGSGTSTTLKQYFSGEQGYAINADYAVIDVQPYSITENGTYTAPFSKAYSPVTVDVQEQPWQPLQDGYSNFWFELTDDTLSPWLNFSAKNDDAVIDWGDGSGEVALDTLTPTHTYSKAGKYVVKVKGVTGIDRQHSAPYTAYVEVLKYVEFNNEVVTLISGAFMNCNGLKAVSGTGTVITTAQNAVFTYCSNLKTVDLTINVTQLYAIFFCCMSLNTFTLSNTIENISANAFKTCLRLSQITIPSSVTQLGSTVFDDCATLEEIHVKATTPPTLGSNTFRGLPADWICYVPVGTGETYKAASGWSAYADHILEEGQTPNRAMLSRFAKAVETDTDDDVGDMR